MKTKNWKAIAALDNAYIKLALIFTKDAGILEGLERGFPECFLEGAQDAPQKFPLSLIKRVMDDYVEINESDRSATDEELAGTLGFPSVECAPHDAVGFKPGGQVPMPFDLVERYDELYASFKESGNFPWKLIPVVIQDIEYYIGYVSDVGVSQPTNNNYNHKMIWLYPAELVDLSA